MGDSGERWEVVYIFVRFGSSPVDRQSKVHAGGGYRGKSRGALANKECV
jgi:hypothetical protein